MSDNGSLLLELNIILKHLGFTFLCVVCEEVCKVELTSVWAYITKGLPVF